MIDFRSFTKSLKSLNRYIFQTHKCEPIDTSNIIGIN